MFFISFGQMQSATDTPCRKKWEYIKTKRILKGSIIYFLPVPGCGYFTSATLAIIKTDSNDTIRVLQVCDTTQQIAPGTKVSLLPNYNDNEFASLIPVDNLNDCIIIPTYYSSLKNE